jgi:hypothetical protein
VLEIEKIWSTVDGFKGAHFYDYITTLDGTVDEKNSFSEEGKASLYYYENKIKNLPLLENYYEFFVGHIDTPDDESIRNLRSGELNFSTLSLKFGIRFKF